MCTHWPKLTTNINFNHSFSQFLIVQGHLVAIQSLVIVCTIGLYHFHI